MRKPVTSVVRACFFDILLRDASKKEILKKIDDSYFKLEIEWECFEAEEEGHEIFFEFSLPKRETQKFSEIIEILKNKVSIREEEDFLYFSGTLSGIQRLVPLDPEGVKKIDPAIRFLDGMRLIKHTMMLLPCPYKGELFPEGMAKGINEFLSKLPGIPEDFFD